MSGIRDLCGEQSENLKVIEFQPVSGVCCCAACVPARDESEKALEGVKEPFSIEGELIEAGNIVDNNGDELTGLLIFVPKEALADVATMPLYRNVRITEITDEQP